MWPYRAPSDVPGRGGWLVVGPMLGSQPSVFLGKGLLVTGYCTIYNGGAREILEFQSISVLKRSNEAMG